MDEYIIVFHEDERGAVRGWEEHGKIVRCSDCKYWDQLEPDHPYGYCMAAKHGYVTSNWDIGIYRKQRHDFFCADGERKEATDDKA